MFDSTSLREDHKTEGFDCEVEALNAWLQREAHRALQSDTARTYVWTEAGSAEVVAYYSIAPTAVIRAELTGRQAGGFSFDIPGYLLARLALDRSLRGQGLGKELLVDAIGKMVGASEAYGGRLIVVDATDANAAAFYQRFNFLPVKGRPNRLVLKISTARALITGG
jgi:GNAT superfamily N-acetyltransferase